jgi:hypothetical protein
MFQIKVVNLNELCILCHIIFYTFWGVEEIRKVQFELHQSY